MYLLQRREEPWAERLPLISLQNNRGPGNRAALELHKVRPTPLQRCLTKSAYHYPDVASCVELSSRVSLYALRV